MSLSRAEHRSIARGWVDSRVMVVLVRIVLPIALVVAGGLILAFSGPIVIGIGLIVLAFFSVLTNFLIRLAISSQDDRDKEAAARERYIETGRWSSR